MRTALAASLVLAALAIAGPAPASAAERSRLDRTAQLRFALDGKTLRISFTRRRIREWRDRRDPLEGKRIEVACGTSFRFSRSDSVTAAGRWLDGSKAISARFPRDISRRAKWCVLDEPSTGADLGFVSFVRREPLRFIAKGRGPSGDWWRLAGHRGNRLEPCVMVRFRLGGGTQCFQDFAEREAGLGFGFDILSCDSDVFVFGVASLDATRVRVGTRGSPPVEVPTHRRPKGSRVRARFFMAALPRGSVVRGVRALDAGGAGVGFTRTSEGSSEPDC